jgi:hypothetical protein
LKQKENPLPLYPRRQFLKTAAAGALGASPWLSLACGFFDQFDVLITGGLIYDGSGRPGIIADLGIKNGKIAALGDLNHKSAKRKIDAAGLAVAPGFIDFHSHSDEELLLGAEAQSKIRQGVTTEIIGQDGGSVAPLTENMRAEWSENLKTTYGSAVDWLDFAGYFQRLEKQKIAARIRRRQGQSPGQLRRNREDESAGAGSVSSRRIWNFLRPRIHAGKFCEHGGDHRALQSDGRPRHLLNPHAQ